MRKPRLVVSLNGETGYVLDKPSGPEDLGHTPLFTDVDALLEGDSLTLTCKMMSDEEIEALDEFRGW